MKQYLVLDIGGTFVKYALMGEDASIISQGKVPANRESMEAFLEGLDPIREAYAGQYEGVAVSMPGRIDTAKGIAHTGGAFKFIRECPIGELLEEKFGKPVVAANDAKCAASAELLDGAFADVDSGVILVLGTGIGGGVVIDHKVWMGCSAAAGELSWYPFGMSYVEAGNWDALKEDGMWTRYISANGLLRLYARRKGIEEEDLDGMKFFEAYDAGETEAVETLDYFGKIAAAGIFGIQCTLDVNRFAIGGGISARPEVVDIIRKKIDEAFSISDNIPFSKPEVVPCRYGNDANLIGALNFFLTK